MSVQTPQRFDPRDATLITPAVLDTPTELLEKTVLYDCGTAAPGQVHDPCQHSTVMVLCCNCAGCTFDWWSCGQEPITDSYLWWEAHVIADRFDPWVRHPYALVLYSLLAIFALTSQIIQFTLEIFVGLWLFTLMSGVFVIKHFLL